MRIALAALVAVVALTGCGSVHSRPAAHPTVTAPVFGRNPVNDPIGKVGP